MLSSQFKTLIAIIVFIISFSVFDFSLQAQITWGTTIDIAPSSFGNHHPRIVSNGLGNPLVIWGNSNNLMYSRWNGVEFTTPISLNSDNISIAEGSWMGPDIAAHGDTIYVVFKQTPESSPSSHIWCIRSFDGGQTFSTPVQVDDIGDSISRFPTITTDDFGNPIIGFMKFDSDFGNPRWVVTKSIDFGGSFLSDVLASGWSGPTAEVCDCCPGAITCSGSSVAMLYRDNNENIRDTWAGISTDTGASFGGGMDVDQKNWMIFSCPSSGPDGVIIGDTLYATFMSAAGGNTRVYFSKSSISSMDGSEGRLISENTSGLELQNFPRIANSSNAVAIAWKQVVNGESQLAVLFTENIISGFPMSNETIAFSSVNNSDVNLTSENIFVVWQDSNSGTVKYRSGTYSTMTSLEENKLENIFSVYPNPSSDSWILSGGLDNKNLKIELFDLQGHLISSKSISTEVDLNLKIKNSDLSSGIYFLRISNNKEQVSLKLIKE